MGRDSTPILENQMEKSIDDELKAWCSKVAYRKT